MKRREFLETFAVLGAVLPSPHIISTHKEKKYDLLLKGGKVIDPGRGWNALKDVAIENGRIAAVEDNIPSNRASQVFDASGKIVTPGLIDLHVHVYPGVSHYGIEPDPTCVGRGVTTALDLGSSGYYTFRGLRCYVIERALTRIPAYLNISSVGLVSALYNEWDPIGNASARLATEMALKNKDTILGIKIRMTKALKDLGLAILGVTRRAADAAGIPIAVHPPGGVGPSLSEVVSRLKPGDMVTHFMHGGENTILDNRGEVLPAIREARERGVYFDVGHGRSSFAFDVAEKALQDGFLPDTISSDVHVYNLKGPVFDLITTLSKFLYLGLTLEQVIERATTRPAKVLRRADLGTLKVGSEADVAILDLRQGQFELVDSLRQRRAAEQRLFSVATVRAGKLIEPAAAEQHLLCPPEA